jgi:hypothetical protein
MTKMEKLVSLCSETSGIFELHISRSWQNVTPYTVSLRNPSTLVEFCGTSADTVEQAVDACYDLVASRLLPLLQ